MVINVEFVDVVLVVDDEGEVGEGLVTYACDRGARCPGGCGGGGGGCVVCVVPIGWCLGRCKGGCP